MINIKTIGKIKIGEVVKFAAADVPRIGEHVILQVQHGEVYGLAVIIKMGQYGDYEARRDE